ncbi:hypothetical protein K6L05_03625 [Salinicoccus roseus]|uniref:hypothetical protein n=1 Tax=Salinicoccus roseus TaxID=45670 RepID=UPI001CA600C3|nr:hypothetical protein [Salinicoccus roseus]MBY8908874.1 hypothetical protein [Salinicoccus roseus]
MNTQETDYSELLAEIADAEEENKLKARSYNESELFLINAIIEGAGYPLKKAITIVLNDQLELYKGITEMAEVAYHDYKEQKSGAVADMDGFSLELVYELERYVDWYRWGLELQKESNYIWSNKGIIKINN